MGTAQGGFASAKSRKKSESANSKLLAKNSDGGINRVRLVGVIASATRSRENTLARRIEIPIAGMRESIDLECEKGEFFTVFRKLRINQWVEIQGRIRRRYWRSGGSVASRSFVEVLRITPL